MLNYIEIAVVAESMICQSIVARKILVLSTLESALELIEKSDFPLNCYRGKVPESRSERRAMYFIEAEVFAWGEEYQVEFIRNCDVDPDWRKYLRLQRRVRTDLACLENLESRWQKEDDSELSARLYSLEYKQPLVDPRPSDRNIISPRVEVGLHALLREIDGLRSNCIAMQKNFQRLSCHNRQLEHDLARLTTDSLQSYTTSQIDAPDLCKVYRRNNGNPVFHFRGKFLSAVKLRNFEEVIPKNQLMPQLQPSYVSAVPGIYFLLNDQDEIVYIGQSTNVVARIGAHLNDPDKTRYFSKVAAVAVRPEQLDAVEQAYINAYQPPLNKTTKAWREAKRSREEKARLLRQKNKRGVELAKRYGFET